MKLFFIVSVIIGLYECGPTSSLSHEGITCEHIDILPNSDHNDHSLKHQIEILRRNTEKILLLLHDILIIKYPEVLNGLGILKDNSQMQIQMSETIIDLLNQMNVSKEDDESKESDE